MRTTVEIDDELHRQVMRLAKSTGRPMRALLEEGLRLVIENARSAAAPYKMVDCSVGDPEAPNPLEHMSRQDLRDDIYGMR